MFEKLQIGEKSIMHQDSLEPAAIQFTLECIHDGYRCALGSLCVIKQGVSNTCGLPTTLSPARSLLSIIYR